MAALWLLYSELLSTFCCGVVAIAAKVLRIQCFGTIESYLPANREAVLNGAITFFHEEML